MKTKIIKNIYNIIRTELNCVCICNNNLNKSINDVKNKIINNHPNYIKDEDFDNILKKCIEIHKINSHIENSKKSFCINKKIK